MTLPGVVIYLNINVLALAYTTQYVIENLFQREAILRGSS